MSWCAPGITMWHGTVMGHGMSLMSRHGIMVWHGMVPYCYGVVWCMVWCEEAEKKNYSN